MLQVEPYNSNGRLSPILTSPNSPFSTRPHRRSDRAYDRYGSLDIRQAQDKKSRDKFGSLDRSAAMNRYGYREQRDRSLERQDYTSHSNSMQRNRSLDRDYPMVSLSSRSLADTDADSEADLR